MIAAQTELSELDPFIINRTPNATQATSSTHSSTHSVTIDIPETHHVKIDQPDIASIENVNENKDCFDNNLNINFFTRSHVPHNSSDALRQLGMIGFTKAALQEYTKLLSTPLEELESIDMMRLLENDFAIKGVLSSSPILGVDNPEDIFKVEQMMMQDELIDLYKEKYK